MAQLSSMGKHGDIIDQAIRNVLATEIALETFAQIIDGLPTSEVHLDTGNFLFEGHPLWSHTILCPGAFEEAERSCETFDPSSLVFQPELLKMFEAAEPTSKTFQLRLIEIIAVAIHQIAVFLSQGEHVHDPATTNGSSITDVASFHPPRRPSSWPDGTGWTTMFYVKLFTNITQYPNGAHDMVGYWAENRILGGVPLFNRCADWSKRPDGEEPNVYFDCLRRGTTSLMCQLVDEQLAEIVRFLTLKDVQSASDDDSYILPMVPCEKNVNRLCSSDGVDYKVYRDIWEKIHIPETQRSMVLCRRRPRNHSRHRNLYRRVAPTQRDSGSSTGPFRVVSRNTTYDWPMLHTDEERRGIIKTEEKGRRERIRKLKQQREEREKRKGLVPTDEKTC